ncbi:MAG: polysaccharide export outer membrane protein [Gammaproteobacteria bacterium]|jgi:polysaccharide export outer membrane protein|nr:polysaccharide export outer membrane protein [Gammaproteobacteria bacterium]
MFKKSFVVLSVLALSGCGIAPGMKMEAPSEKLTYQANQLKISPNFVLISNDLVSSMTKDRPLYQYKVGPEDVLNIVVWGHPELAYPVTQAVTQQGLNTDLNPTITPSGFLVGAEGSIYFPLIGSVDVSGKTISEIRVEMAQKLSKYVRNPQIDVRVSSYRSNKVYVMGEVNKPGLQPITDIPLTIADAINLTGGLSQDSADPSHIYVIRGDIMHPTVYWLNAKSPEAMLLAEHFYLQNRDIVFVSTADVARWNRAISQIMPTIQTIWYTQSTIKQAGG